MSNKYLIGTIVIFLVVFQLFFFNKDTVTISETKNINLKENIFDLYQQQLQQLPSHDMYCVPIKKSFCSFVGCQNSEPSVFILLGKSLKTNKSFLARCDSKPCDIYYGELRKSGSYTTFKPEESYDILFKISNTNNHFTEITTLGTDSFISSGTCYSK